MSEIEPIKLVFEDDKLIRVYGEYSGFFLQQVISKLCEELENRARQATPLESLVSNGDAK
jgi:hypothetical protein